jgi:ABC-type multidrug transport system fused ATPase/permease subunit
VTPFLTKTLSVLTAREKKQWAWLTTYTLLISMADIISLALLVYIIHFYTQPVDAARIFIPVLGEPFATALFNRSSLLLISVFFVIFSLKNLAAWFVHARQTRFVHQVAARISRNNMLQYLEGNYANYIHTDSSVLTRTISLQPLEFGQHVLAPMQQVFTEGVLIILAITAILIFNAQLFLVLLLILLPPVFLTAWLTKRKGNAARSYIKSSRSAMWRHLHESIAGFVESNLYDRTSFFTERYAHSQQVLNKHQADLHSLQALPARLAEVFAVFGLLVLIAISTWWQQGYYATHFVTLGAFMAAAYKIIPGIARIMNAAGQIRTFSFTIHDLVQQRPPEKQTIPVSVQPIESIAFEQVTFNYEHKQVLHNFSCQLQSGELIGIDGHSGKGKTTLINILLGFMSPQTGRILINQQPTDSWQRKQYWQQIAFVKQQPFFMYDTVLANITLNGKPQHEQRLQQALELTGINAWLPALPAGMDTVLTENGKNISGGQRQRIALARALYKNARVLILDEPFSELDEKAEEQLLQHLQQLAAEGKLVILITHNRKSLEKCAKVINL